MELRVNSEVTGYDQDGVTITAHLSNGEDVSGTLLVGADGLHSQFAQSWWATAHANLWPLDISSRDPGRVHA